MPTPLKTQHGIGCKSCGSSRIAVIESRHNPIDNVVRRRRLCKACGHRFTTYETTVKPSVINDIAEHATSYLIGDQRMNQFLDELEALITKWRSAPLPDL